MRSALTTMVGLALFTSACGGGGANTNGSSAGSTTGQATTGGNTSGGATGGATGGTSGGTTAGAGTTTGAAQGTICTDNAQCASNACGINGNGNCCSVACNTSDSICGAVGCDSNGNCVYPVEDAGTAIRCSGTCDKGELTTLFCDTAGACSVSTGTPTVCPNNFACDAAGDSCNTTCTTLTDCASGFNCVAGACVAQITTGACTENNACSSFICGLSGAGNCCLALCGPSPDSACDPVSCDVNTGACVFPVGGACGAANCVNSKLSGVGACDTNGNCRTNPVSCAGNLGCNAAGTACNTTCTTVADCAHGFYCDNDAGGCVHQIATGPCFENDQCTSLVCGLAGSGNCCAAACASGDATCGANACDGTNGACTYPDSTVACGTTLESCTAGVQQNPSACDGQGNCNASPGTKDCTPFLCSANACFTTCTDVSSCIAGSFCETADSACCNSSDLPGDGTGEIFVDASSGSDAVGCCGIGGNTACKTISHAMQIIDSAQAANVTLHATIKGGGGNWTAAGEVYPIVLGWGVELSAAGVYFEDPKGGNPEIFDIKSYSANDSVGTASIVGAPQNQIGIGMSSTNAQSSDSSAIQVESGATLYLANATVNGSANNATTAITVIGGGTLTLAQDATAAVTGTVTIGNSNTGNGDGWIGIACTNNGGVGCTITDATLPGSSSLVIENQDFLDIDAEDFASITLTSAPIIGLAPSAPGFQACPSKNDAISSDQAAVLLNGAVTMTFNNGTVQCIAGDGFLLQSTPNGSAALTMDTTTIQNTEYGIFAVAGTAAVSNSTIQFNYNGVMQGDGAAVDLSGGSVGGTNTVVCSNSAESNFGNGTPGVSVLNTSATTDLNASNVLWDTVTPDQFQCDSSLTSCTCTVAACTTAPGTDGMDAVFESTAVVNTANNGLSGTTCPVSCGGAGVCGAQNPICCSNFTFDCCAPDMGLGDAQDCFRFCD